MTNVVNHTESGVWYPPFFWRFDYLSFLGPPLAGWICHLVSLFYFDSDKVSGMDSESWGLYGYYSPIFLVLAFFLSFASRVVEFFQKW
jgi:hypothetical protein